MFTRQTGTLILSSIFAFSLYAEDYCCDPCVPPEEECIVDEHLFVTRRQLFINAEFLYWTVEEGALDFAVRMKQAASTPETFTMGKYKVADFDWRPGFRVSLAWYNEPKYWEVNGQYTWLYDKGSDHVHKPNNPELFINPTWHTINIGPFQEAHSLIRVHYHVGDFYASRVFDPNPHLRMRISAGATLSYIKQKWRVRYTDFIGNFDFIKNKWRFFGGGLRVGTTFDWFWTYQYYVTGKVSFASLLGTYENETIQHLQTNQIVRKGIFDDHRLAFHTQFLVGPSWQRPSECWSAEIFVGYELNVWWNLHEVIRSGPPSAPYLSKETNLARGLFGLHGLTVRTTVGF